MAALGGRATGPSPDQKAATAATRPPPLTKFKRRALAVSKCTVRVQGASALCLGVNRKQSKDREQSFCPSSSFTSRPPEGNVASPHPTTFFLSPGSSPLLPTLPKAPRPHIAPQKTQSTSLCWRCPASCLGAGAALSSLGLSVGRSAPPLPHSNVNPHKGTITYQITHSLMHTSAPHTRTHTQPKT